MSSSSKKPLPLSHNCWSHPILPSPRASFPPNTPSVGRQPTSLGHFEELEQDTHLEPWEAQAQQQSSTWAQAVLLMFPSRPSPRCELRTSIFNLLIIKRKVTKPSVHMGIHTPSQGHTVLRDVLAHVIVKYRGHSNYATQDSLFFSIF